jgi:cysteine desulfurase
LTIYFDNLAATPTDPRVAERYREATARYPGNPHSSEHSAGVEAQAAIDGAADALLSALNSGPQDVLFTPGASAALWLAVEDSIARAGGRQPHIAASAAEHPALLSALRRAERSGRILLTMVRVDGAGAPCLDAVENALSQGIDLLCTMAANNEVGTLTDLSVIHALTARSGTRHLVDASQAAGKTDPADLVQADLIIVSGAKIYGPRRAGAIIGALGEPARDHAHDLFGSPDAPSAIALAFAMQLRAVEREADEARLTILRDRLQSQLVDTVPGLRVNGDPDFRLAGSLHVSTPHLPGDAAVARVWGRVAVSTGAACQSGVPGPSHVLAAMGLPEWAGDLIAAALSAAEPARKLA